MYTIEGDDLVAQHYCSMANQPVLRLDRGRSTAKELRFEFDHVAGRHDDHLHDGWIRYDIM